MKYYNVYYLIRVDGMKLNSSSTYLQITQKRRVNCVRSL